MASNLACFSSAALTRLDAARAASSFCFFSAACCAATLRRRCIREFSPSEKFSTTSGTSPHLLAASCSTCFSFSAASAARLSASSRSIRSAYTCFHSSAAAAASTAAKSASSLARAFLSSTIFSSAFCFSSNRRSSPEHKPIRQLKSSAECKTIRYI